MIRFAFTKPDITGPHADGPQGSTKRSYYVVHPSNGAIIAYADTKAEAEAVAGLLAGLVELVRENQDAPFDCVVRA